MLPFPDSFSREASFKKLSDKLIKDLYKNSKKQLRNRADGSRREEMNFHVAYSKPIIDEIDRVLAKHYGLTNEELDFMINYDIKYRMGRDIGGDEDG